tara:strand:- start:845 stop:2125 length:1281 start_codon:yes stop_codon:yes gene_type:complete
MKPLILVELNEVSFKFIQKYIDLGELPNFKKLLKKHKVLKTHSEKEYRLLEPWIQWVTVHTGFNFDDHKIFRLGDGQNQKENIWNKLYERNINSLLVSPMNSVNPNLQNSIYVPDPWNNSGVNGGIFLKFLHKSISSIVNSNAKNKFKLFDLFLFLISFLRFAKFKNYFIYSKILFKFPSKKWNKAILLDLLLADVFIGSLNKKYGFSSIFLNASAHIQHHYFHSSKVYKGDKKNPDWYCSKGKDPLLDVYRAYDSIVENLYKFKEKYRIIYVTGLSQEPTLNPTYYWRLKNHRKFLKQLKINFLEIEPRMSRDFLVTFNNNEDAIAAEQEFIKLTIDGKKVFEIDNRGLTLFVTLTYSKPIKNKTPLYLENNIFIKNFFKYISLVALKNGEHNETGYFIDTDLKDDDLKNIPLTRVHEIILENYK